MQVKALEHKYHNPERSAVAPAVLQWQIPVAPHELSGQLAQLSPASLSDYHSVMIDEHEVLPSTSSQNVSIVSGSHSSYPGPSISRHPSNKHQEDSSLENIQSRKTRKRTCQKCGDQNCAGASIRKYCIKPCQDCGKTECRGRK